MVILEASEGSWRGDTIQVGGVLHDEENDENDYTGDVSSGNDLSASDLRGVLIGVIGNDVNGSGTLTGDESRAGVVVELYHAPGDIREGFVAGDAVTDEDGDPVTATTDEDGGFRFTGLEFRQSDGGQKFYLLKVPETDLYKAVRNTPIGLKDDELREVVNYAIHPAVTADLADDWNTLYPNPPKWDYSTSMLGVSALTDFVLLYKNGQVEGTVSDPSARAAHQRAVVELHRCKKSNQERGGCDEYSGEVKEVSVNSDGEWLAENLLEGIWEVVVDLPAGYVHVDASGRTDGETGFNDDDTYFSQQGAELMGGRADASTETFHIKDRNAGGEAVLTSVEINGDACGLGAADDNTTNRCADSDDGEISVVVEVSDGATVRLSNSATNARVSTSSMRSFAVDTDDGTEFTLAKAGSERFFVHVAAEDGYSTNAADVATAAGFTVRRDSDTRMNMLTIKWAGDRIDLDRRDLGLDPGNPDGETAPVTGTTTLSVQLDEGDNGAAVPDDEALTIEVVGKDTGFDFLRFSAVLEETATNSGTFGDCPDAFDAETGTLTVEGNAPATGKGEAAICFRITDSDGDADNVDANTNNTNTYRLILTRK